MPSSSSPAGEALSLPQLAQKMQELAQALVACVDSLPAADDLSKSVFKAPLAEAIQPEAPQYERRCYHIASSALREEKELLEHYGVDSFAEALFTMYNDLYGIAFLMKRWDYDEDCRGVEVIRLAEHLERLLQPLEKACSVMADFRLEQQTACS